MNKIKQVLRENIGLLIMIAISAVIFLIATGYLDSAYNKKARLQSEIAELKNQIEHVSSQNDNQSVVIIENELGLDLERKNKDDRTMVEWISPAFTFDNSNEYNANREIFVERLGQDDQFVKEIMPPYIDGITAGAEYDKDGNLISSEGAKFNMEIASNGFESYVVSVDDKTGVYQYLATLKVTSHNKNGYSGTGKTVVLTYSVDKDGNISDFHAATPQ